jgi:hypothetical protein
MVWDDGRAFHGEGSTLHRESVENWILTFGVLNTVLFQSPSIDFPGRVLLLEIGQIDEDVPVGIY